MNEKLIFLKEEEKNLEEWNPRELPKTFKTMFEKYKTFETENETNKETRNLEQIKPAITLNKPNQRSQMKNTKIIN